MWDDLKSTSSKSGKLSLRPKILELNNLSAAQHPKVTLLHVPDNISGTYFLVDTGQYSAAHGSRPCQTTYLEPHSRKRFPDQVLRHPSDDPTYQQQQIHLAFPSRRSTQINPRRRFSTCQ